MGIRKIAISGLWIVAIAVAAVLLFLAGDHDDEYAIASAASQAQQSR